MITSRRAFHFALRWGSSVVVLDPVVVEGAGSERSPVRAMSAQL